MLPTVQLALIALFATTAFSEVTLEDELFDEPAARHRRGLPGPAGARLDPEVNVRPYKGSIIKGLEPRPIIYNPDKLWSCPRVPIYLQDPRRIGAKGDTGRDIRSAEYRPFCKSSCYFDGQCSGRKKCCSNSEGCRSCTCPPLNCRLYCAGGFQTDRYGCQICACKPVPPTCSPRCRNGGVCISYNRCKCPSNYGGSRCETPICRPSCQNGATCLAGNRCSCRPNYSGYRCGTQDIKAWTCPRYSIYPIYPVDHVGPAPLPHRARRRVPPRPYPLETCRYHQCRTDSSCQGSKKCCLDRNGCRRCTCPPFSCSLRCAYGYRRGSDGCSVCQCNPPPRCTPSCQNGGRCTATNVCTCTSQFTGSRCEKRKDKAWSCPRVDYYPPYDPERGPSGGRQRQGAPGPRRIDEDIPYRPTCIRHRCNGDSNCPGRKKCCVDYSNCRQCTCPPFTCTLRCANGYRNGPDGCPLCECNIQPICRPSCKNGGTCIATNTCRCRPPYTGPTCTTLEEPRECPREGATGTNDCGQSCTCRNGRWVNCCRIRKEIHSMSQSERQLYIDTYKQASLRSDFRALIRAHEQFFGSGIHSKPQFLPWHRYFTLAIENILQQINCRVTMPYWAWCLNANSPWNANLWQPANHWYGGNGVGGGRCVQTGPFRAGTWSPSVGGGCLQRNFQGRVPNCVIVNDVLSAGVAQFDTFEFRLRRQLHDVVHCRVGGLMCSGRSAEAPEFFLHHNYIDKLWGDYQSRSTAHRDVYFSSLTGTMTAANGTTARQWLDLSRQPGNICVKYEEPASRVAARLRSIFKTARRAGLSGPRLGAVACSQEVPRIDEAAASLFPMSAEDRRRLQGFLNRQPVCAAGGPPNVGGKPAGGGGGEMGPSGVDPNLGFSLDALDRLVKQQA